MRDLRKLEEELEAWRRAGRAATLWWRDDDAVEPSAALDRLLDLAAGAGAPLCLAVIPARASGALAWRLTGHPTGGQEGLTVAQHGFRHANHAPDGEKRAELGPHRPASTVREELARGRGMLLSQFEDRLAPLLVPPWNRIDEALIPDLPALGFRGLSRHTPRRTVTPAPGLVECNTHLDVLRWRPERGFVGEETALRLLIGHLRARRLGDVVSPGEPSGLLTHHLVMDEPAWAFVGALADILKDHPAARWLSAADAFAPGPAAKAVA